MYLEQRQNYLLLIRNYFSMLEIGKIVLMMTMFGSAGMHRPSAQYWPILQ